MTKRSGDKAHQDNIARRVILCPLHATLAITVLITSCLATGPSHAHDFTIEISLGLNRLAIALIVSLDISVMRQAWITTHTMNDLTGLQSLIHTSK